MGLPTMSSFGWAEGTLSKPWQPRAGSLHVSKSVVDTIGLGDKQFSQSSLNHKNNNMWLAFSTKVKSSPYGTQFMNSRVINNNIFAEIFAKIR